MSMNRLDGHTILVAEDEPLVSLDVTQLLQEFGATVVAASSVRTALIFADGTKIAAAVLDINLAGEDCSPVCQRLSELGIPFLFHTGYTDAPVFKMWSAAPVINKPASGERIIEALTRMNHALHRYDGQYAGSNHLYDNRPT
jgi:CheY-like chemotaxis protein